MNVFFAKQGHFLSLRTRLWMNQEYLVPTYGKNQRERRELVRWEVKMSWKCWFEVVYLLNECSHGRWNESLHFCCSCLHVSDNRTVSRVVKSALSAVVKNEVIKRDHKCLWLLLIASLLFWSRRRCYFFEASDLHIYKGFLTLSAPFRFVWRSQDWEEKMRPEDVRSALLDIEVTTSKMSAL